jgi:hypothetical protein
VRVQRVADEVTQETKETGKYGGSTGQVLRQLRTGVKSGRPILPDLRQTGPPHGARTHTGGRCSCPTPAPTSPKNCSAAAGVLQHQGDGDFGGRRGRVHARNNDTVEDLTGKLFFATLTPMMGSVIASIIKAYLSGARGRLVEGWDS